MLSKRADALVATGMTLVATAVLLATIQQSSAAKAKSSWRSPLEPKVKNPLIYKRLRFDQYYLQVYRRVQKHLAIDEKQVTVKLNVTPPTSNKPAEEVTFNYYQNDQVEATNFTYDDLVFEAIDRAYLTRLWPAFIYNYDKPGDVDKASDPKLVDASRCDRELNFLMRSLEVIKRAREDERTTTGIRTSNAISPELLAFFDAFANEETGLLLGNSHWTGENWRECNKRLVLNVDQKVPSNSVEFHGRYCIASLRSKNWESKIPERVAELEARNYFETPAQRNNYIRFFRLQVGFCLPESCDSRILKKRSDDIHKLATFKLRQPMRSYRLDDLYCLPDETSELRKIEPSGKLLIYFATVWFGLILWASITDYHEMRAELEASRTERSGEQSPTSRPVASFRDQMISVFSLFKNWDRLMDTKWCQPTPTLSEQIPDLTTALEAADSSASTDLKQNGQMPPSPVMPKMSPNDLLYFNFLKAFLMPFVIYGHVGMQWKELDRFPNDYDASSVWLTHTHVNGIFFVDWYFAITGFLTTYTMFVTNRVARNSLMDWIYSVFHRYWRLAPLYILLFWFAQTLFMHLGTGPLWDYGSSNMTFRSICRDESWIYPLTLTANWHAIPHSCIMTAWYGSSDFQFYLLMPFLMVLLYKSPALGWLAGFGVIGLSISLRFYRYMTDVRAMPLELMRPRFDMYARNNWDMYPTYLYTHYRIPSSIIGVLAGHYTYMVLSGKWKSYIYVNPSALVAANQSGRGRKKTIEQMEYIIDRAQTRRLLISLIAFVVMNSVFWATWIVSTVYPTAYEAEVKVFTAMVYSFHHSISATSVSVFLVTIMLGQFEAVKRFMSWTCWSVLSKLNYLVLITQVEAMYYFVQSADRPSELNDFEFLKMQIYVCAVIYPICVFLSVTFEFPLVQLERYFIHPIFNKKKPAPSVTPAAPEPGKARVLRSNQGDKTSDTKSGR